MAGIEEAFENFVKRVSSQEEPQSEYGDPQTGEKRIPIMQGIKRGYDFENTMPNIYNQRYGYENETPVYDDDRYNIPQQELAYGGRAGYFLGGAIKKAIGEIGEKFTPEQQEVILKNPSVGKGIGSMIRGALGSIFKKISNNKPQPTPDLSLKLDRPVQSGDPIGSYYANPNNPALASVAPPTTNPLTRPLSMAGFYGSEIFDILKRSGFNFADGGRVSMSEGGLTTTVPPAKGPDSQGVESLFRRRYI
jgi:hypothetical protein